MRSTGDRSMLVLLVGVLASANVVAGERRTRGDGFSVSMVGRRAPRAYSRRYWGTRPRDGGRDHASGAGRVGSAVW